MPALVTRFIKVAQSGPCVDGRTIDPQWLHDMADGRWRDHNGYVPEVVK